MNDKVIPATLIHDAGAYARCSYCGRYSDNPKSLTFNLQCECGKWAGWSGSFKTPDSNSVFSRNTKGDQR